MKKLLSVVLVLLFGLTVFAEPFNSYEGSTEIGTSLSAGTAYFGSLTGQRVAVSTTSCSTGCAATGRAGTAVGWSATINPPIASGFMRVTFVDTNQVSNPYANYTTFPNNYGSLSCDIPNGGNSCNVAYPTGLAIANADQLEPVIWVFGTGTAYTGQIKWALNYQ